MYTPSYTYEHVYNLIDAKTSIQQHRYNIRDTTTQFHQHLYNNSIQQHIHIVTQHLYSIILTAAAIQHISNNMYATAFVQQHPYKKQTYNNIFAPSIQLQIIIGYATTYTQQLYVSTYLYYHL